MANERIYLVTADSDRGMQLYGTLERNGYAVELFASPQDALSALEKEQLPDVVITEAFSDATPGGLDVLALTGRKEAVGFLLTDAATAARTEAKARETGGPKTHLLDKSADEETLLSALVHGLMAEGSMTM
jgi:CheY-like chemotaxis protein